MTIERSDAISGTVVSPRVSRIIRLEAEYEDLLTRTDGNRWETAELYAKELETKSQRQLAREVGKTHTHIGYMAKCWQLKLPGDDRPFNQVYNSPEVRGTPKRELPREQERPGPAPERSGELPPGPAPSPDESIKIKVL